MAAMGVKNAVVVIAILGFTLRSAEGNFKHQGKLTQAVVKAAAWLSQQNTSVLIDEHHYGLFVASLSLTGYPVIDSHGCAANTKTYTTQLHSILLHHKFSQNDFGGMAHLLFGAKALCLKEKWMLTRQHFTVLKTKLRLYSLNRCQDMFKYALGILGLAIHREGIPSAVADTMIFKSYKSCNSVDIDSVVALALKAIADQYGRFRSTKQRATFRMEKITRKLLDGFKKQYVAKNVYGYALLGQLLLQTAASPLQKHVLHIIQAELVSVQKADGSFGDTMRTIHIVPVLAQSTILDLTTTDCSSSFEIASGTASKGNQEAKNITVTYRINFAESVSRVSAPVSFDIPHGSTGTDGLTAASQVNECFRFRASKSDWGLMIEEVCGIAQLPEKGKYWSYTVNGAKPSVGLASYPLADGDFVVLTYGEMSL